MFHNTRRELDKGVRSLYMIITIFRYEKVKLDKRINQSQSIYLLSNIICSAKFPTWRHGAQHPDTAARRRKHRIRHAIYHDAGLHDGSTLLPARCAELHRRNWKLYAIHSFIHLSKISIYSLLAIFQVL